MKMKKYKIRKYSPLWWVGYAVALAAVILVAGCATPSAWM